jgi:ubiquinone/menaquinone biosynthesis C-methylase UbiE
MSDSADYDAVADLYDLYVRSDFDLAFFREEASKVDGPVLELMAGTGRVSVSLATACSLLVCADRSWHMLSRLVGKLEEGVHTAHASCADVRNLLFRARFDLALMPFHSFAELTDAADQQRAMMEVCRILTQHGRFVCTLHNPRIRRASLDNQTRLLGAFPRPEGGHIDLWVTGTHDPQSGIARSTQRCDVYDAEGHWESETLQRVDFALIEHDDFCEMAAAAEFDTRQTYGDYDRSAFDPASSPYMIYVLQRRSTAP